MGQDPASQLLKELQDPHGAGLGPEVTEADYFQGYLPRLSQSRSFLLLWEAGMSVKKPWEGLKSQSFRSYTLLCPTTFSVSKEVPNFCKHSKVEERRRPNS